MTHARHICRHETSENSAEFLNFTARVKLLTLSMHLNRPRNTLVIHFVSHLTDNGTRTVKSESSIHIYAAHNVKAVKPLPSLYLLLSRINMS